MAELISESSIHKLNPTFQKEWGKLFNNLSLCFETNEKDKDEDSDISDKIVDKYIKHLYRDVIHKTTGDSMSLRFISPCYKPRHLINHYFDHIYILNLDSRPDRMDHMREQLHELGIYSYERFSALYGKESPHLEEWKKYSKVPLTRLERTKYQRKAIASPGSWAIIKSMYLMIRDAQSRGFKNFLVLQDDLLFHKSFHKQFDQLVNNPNFPKTWKLFYIGATQHTWTHVRFHKSQKFYHPSGTADGAFGVGVDSSIYDEFINELLEFDMPTDSGALKTLQRRYSNESIVAFPNLVIADLRDSDLRGYRDLDTFSKKFRWDLKNYNIVDNLKPDETKMRQMKKDNMDW